MSRLDAFQQQKKGTFLQGLERGLPALGTIGAGAPLLGLLSTVLGMIAIFKIGGGIG